MILEGSVHSPKVGRVWGEAWSVKAAQVLALRKQRPQGRKHLFVPTVSYLLTKPNSSQ